MFLRLLLFAGLVLHKVVWEVTKRKVPQADRRPPRTTMTSLVKAAKMAVLGFLVVQTLFLDLWRVPARPEWLPVSGAVVYMVGLALAITGRLHLGGNWLDIEEGRVTRDQKLVTNGVYRYVRHPIYAGDLLLLLGLEIALESWLVLAAVFPLVVVLVRAKSEELMLAGAFPNYAEYCRRTKRFVPFVV